MTKIRFKQIEDELEDASERRNESETRLTSADGRVSKARGKQGTGEQTCYIFG